MRGRNPLSGIGTVEKTRTKNKWRIRVSLGKDPVTGKYIKSPSRTITGTKTDATQALLEYRAELMSGDMPEESDLTIGEYAMQFHNEREHEFRSPLAWQRETYEINRIVEYFGAYRLQALDTRTIRRVYARLRKDGFNEGMMHRIHQKLSQIMKQAENDELIQKNPCNPIKISRPKAKERKSLSAEDAQRLNAILLSNEPNAFECAVLLALHTGMRRGEVLGLTWQHVHFDKKKIYVAKQYSCNKIVRDPKSKKSIRWLSFDDEVLEYLMRWKELQKDYLEVQAAKITEEDIDKIVFSQTDESPVVNNSYGYYCDPNIFARWFRNFCANNGFGEMGKIEYHTDNDGRTRAKKTGYKGLTFHELRHTQATLLIGNGADIKTVQNRLGHSSASLTMDIYSHAIEQNDRTAAEDIGGILSNKKKGIEDE